jgi:phage-related protein
MIVRCSEHWSHPRELFELRKKSGEGIGRLFYCTLVATKIVMLYAFIKKSEQTPANVLAVARRRMKEVKANAYS